ncbi:MAG: hypothetical protein QW057_09585 [Candidatus Bathyarchaeia archaeon]
MRVYGMPQAGLEAGGLTLGVSIGDDDPDTPPLPELLEEPVSGRGYSRSIPLGLGAS